MFWIWNINELFFLSVDICLEVGKVDELGLTSILESAMCR